MRGSQKEDIAKDEMSENLSGSEIAARMERGRQELGRPRSLLRNEVEVANEKKAPSMAVGESDRSIVLGERESRSQGEGSDEVVKLAKET
jgi:hypothetical protein